MTSESVLPDPLVPDEVDLRDFGFMPLEVLRLRDSDLAALASGDEFKAAVLLWCFAWHQVPAASVPNDDRILAKHSGAGANWRKVKEAALRGFVRCADGRLYHSIIAVKALEAWERREEFQGEKENRESRQQRWREKVKRLSELLRDAGVTPPTNCKAKELERLCALHVPGFVDGDASTSASTKASTSASTSASRDTSQETAKTGTGTETRKEIPGRAVSPPPELRALSSPEPAGVPEATDPPEANGHSKTPAGSVCGAMRRAGLAAVNPGDPRLIALLEQGASEAEFVGIAAEAVGKGKGFAWVLTVVQARREEARAISLAQPTSADPEAWRNSRSGVVDRGCRLGIGPWNEVDASNGTGPTWSAYKRRVVEAHELRSQGATA